ncbi:YlqD family protein [Bacillus sp. REN10]|uniref:YlqD family protein n=1 Tax=Bacillus sp. REN10 TaxID=2782541 RepID=UPI00193BF54B|nr:YlqD family protein [Bacillus sp. REN10]
MYILQTVIVKQVLTEKMKRQLLLSYEEQKSQLQREYEQLRFEQKKAEKKYKNSQKESVQLYEREMQKRLDKIQNIEFQVNQLSLLPLGRELKEKELQTMTEVNVGDRWSDIENEKTIVIKDGIIIDIR